MKDRVLTLLLWLMTAGPVLAQSDGEWLWLHPSAGVNSLVDIAVIDGRTAVAVGERSTIARTEDAGKTWQVTDSTWASGHWNAVHFADSSNGWVAGRNGRIYYSADAGRTWHPQQSGTSRHLSDIHFIDSSTGWAAGASGTVLHTTDGGQTWKTQSTGTSEYLYTVLFTDSSTGWIAGENFILLHTTDGGQSWVKDESAEWEGGDPGNRHGRFTSVQFMDDEIGWMVGEVDTGWTDPYGTPVIGVYGVVYHTVDGGQSWQTPSSDLHKGTISVHFVNQDMGWAVQSALLPDMQGGILTTRDGGKTWEPQHSSDPGYYGSVRFLDEQTGWVAGNYGLVLHTNDGGNSWETKSQGAGSTLLDVFFADRETGWAAGYNGTILHTVDGGMSWQRQESGAGNRVLSNMHFVDRKTGWIAGGGRTLLHTEDGGAHWEGQETGTDAGSLRSVFFVDRRTGWIGDDGGRIFHTTNRGQTWMEQDLGAAARDSWVQDIHFTDARIGWMVNWDGDIVHTRDGGQTWELQHAAGFPLSSIYFTDDKTGWTVGRYGTILHTSDGGQSWDEQPVSTTGHLGSIFFTDRLRGWVSSPYDTMFYTEDGGQTWEPVESSLFTRLSRLYFSDAHTGWIVGSRSSIKKFHREPPVAHPELLHPVDGASELEELPELQWEAVDGADSYRVQLSKTYVFNTRAVEIHGVTRTALMPELPDGLEPEGTWYWRVASKNQEGVSHWSEVRSFSMAVPSDAGLQEDLPGDVFLEQNYPNPFNPSTRIRFALPGQVHVHLTVYDLLGRKVAVLVDEVRPGGWHTVTFNADRLSSGVFFYRLEAGGSIQTGKMLYIK